jgi:hypothetical protein
LPTLDGSAPTISAFVAAGRGSNSGRGHSPRGTRGGWAPAGGVAAAAPERGALGGPSAPNSTSTRWALVTM